MGYERFSSLFKDFPGTFFCAGSGSVSKFALDPDPEKNRFHILDPDLPVGVEDVRI